MGGLYMNAFEKAKWGGVKTKGVNPPLDGTVETQH